MPEVKAAAKAFIVHEGKILVNKQNVNGVIIYDLPGGKIEYGETPYETVVREVKEEVGLDVEVDRVAGVYWFYDIVFNNQVIATTFICKPLNFEIDYTQNPSEREHFIDSIWVTPEEFQKLEGGIPDSLYSLVQGIV